LITSLLGLFQQNRSKANICAATHHVRFTLKSGQPLDRPWVRRPLCALRRRSEYFGQFIRTRRNESQKSGVLGPQNVDVAAGNFWAVKWRRDRRVIFGARNQKIVFCDSVLRPALRRSPHCFLCGRTRALMAARHLLLPQVSSQSPNGIMSPFVSNPYFIEVHMKGLT
jgi:hypothetical protein